MKRLTKLSTIKIGPKLWRLTRNLVWRTNDNSIIIIPRGFITDGASTPRALFSICPPMGGGHAESAVLHDYLYSKDCSLEYSRTDADRLFYEGMRSDGVNVVRARTIWAGVRAGGWASYKKCYSKEKA